MHKFTFEFKAISLGSIFGIISKQGKKIEEGLLAEHPAVSLDNCKALAGQQVEISEGGNLKIVSDCRIDYREELGGKLGLIDNVLDRFSDGQLILQAYQKWGESCVEHLLGDFAFAITDQKRDILFCARDQMGCRPFYYYEDDQYFILSSNVKRFEAIPGVSFLPKEKYLLHLFNSKALPVNDAFYSGMKRLAPAHALVFDLKSGPVVKRYWDLEVEPEYSNLSFDEALELYKKLLKDAVSQRIRKYANFGVELSGGLDSSVVTALAREVTPDGTQFHAFSNALSVKHQKQFYPFTDETDYAKKVVSYLGNDNLHLIDNREERGSLEPLAGAMSFIHGPLFQVFPAFSDLLLDKVEEQELHLLLSGFGGDECVTYSASGILHEFAEQGDWSKVGRELENKQTISKLWIYIKLFLEHRVFKRRSYFIRRLLKKGQYRYSLSDLAMNAAYRKLFMKWEKERKKSVKMTDFRIREQQRLRLMHESLSDRMENSYFQAQKRNIEYAYPLLDIKLLSLVYSLPVDYKIRKGVGRYLMREAMKDLLPDEIRLRNNKFGVPIPNISFRISQDREEYLKLIDEAEQNNKFHYLDYDKLRWQLEKLTDQKNFMRLRFGPRIFFSSMSLLLLQKWNREGKMNTGIKC